MNPASVCENGFWQCSPVLACYLFLHQPAVPAVQAGASINDILKQVSTVENIACKLKLDSYDGVCFSKYSGTNFVAIL